MRHNIKLSMLATLPTVTTRQHNLVQLTKKYVLLLLMLATGLVAHATIQNSITMLGRTQTNNSQTHYVFFIESIWGNDRSTGEGSSRTFSNTPITDITLNGTLNFQEGTEMTDVIAGSTFTVTITKNNQWFYGATVQTQSGTDVTDCTVTTSNNHNTLTVTIPQGKTFGTILVDYVVNEPFNSSNTVISGIASEYVYTGSPIVPVPTVTYKGTVLTEGTDYTVSYSNNAVDPLHYTITGHVTVTGTGNYAGSVEQTFSYHSVQLSDFTQLSDGSYQIATRQDLDSLALLVKVSGNDCQGLTFKQTADIAYTYTTTWNSSNSETNFTAIGSNDKPFKGTFDGQNHSISGIRITKTGQSDSDKCQSLFGYVGTGGTVRNVVLGDTRIKGYTGTGGIVGINEGTIEDCRVQSNVLVESSGEGFNPSTDDDGSDFGGIAGSNNNGGTVTRCTSSATIDGEIGFYSTGQGRTQTCSVHLGGIVGNNGGTVSNCLALNAVVTGKAFAAAIVGNNDGTLTANYYRSCTVTNKRYSNGSSINVGVGTINASNDQDGARSVHALTLGTDITATGESVEIDGTTYYASDTTVTLGYSGTVPAGQMPVYLVGGTAIEGNTFTIYANDNTTVSVTMAIVLADNADNSNVINSNTGSGKNVVLTSRRLYKDGDWNTLCLPFEVSTESGPLAGDGVKAMTLKTSTSGFSNGTLTLNFTSATSIPAGTPFIIKWNNTGGTLTDPVFTGVTISTDRHNATVTDVLTFTGTYSPISIGSEGDNTILYLGDNSTLYWPNGTMTIGCQRAYFQLLGGITADDPTSTIKSFVLNFDEETRIRTTNLTNLTNGADAWYDLSGRKLEGKPTQKGIYIHGNKKVIIK